MTKVLRRTCNAGDIWQLGKHRLIVGDATQEEPFARLFGSAYASLVVTSPPYADQRDYGGGVFDWDALMFAMFCHTTAYSESGAHILINLGLVHKEREVQRYWDAFLAYCAYLEWPLFGWYVWDKGSGLPGDWAGRLAPAHEFVFHFNKQRSVAHKWVENKMYGAPVQKNKSFLSSNGTRKFANNQKSIYQQYKVPDSVIRIGRESTRGMHTQYHPAVYPIELPAFVMRTWSEEGDIVFDPFCGSGTTILAAEQEKRICYAMELSTAYASLITARWEEKMQIPAVLLERG